MTETRAEARTRTPVAERFLLWLLVITAITFAVHLFLNYVAIIALDYQSQNWVELSNRFDMNDEASVPSWMSHQLFLVLAGLAFALAWFAGRANRAERAFWLVVGTLATAMSIDDAAGGHEFLLRVLHQQTWGDSESSSTRSAWYLLLPVVLVLGAVLAWVGLRVVPKRTIVLLAIAGGVFLVGGMVVDSMANDHDPWGFAAQGPIEGIENSLEMVGVAIAAYALAALIETRHGAAVSRALAALRGDRGPADDDAVD